MDAVAVVEDEVRELVRRRGLDPVAQPAAVRSLVDEVVAHYGERSLAGGLPRLGDPARVSRSVFDAVAGFGPLQRYFDDPAVGWSCQVVCGYELRSDSQGGGALLPAITAPGWQLRGC